MPRSTGTRARALAGVVALAATALLAGCMMLPPSAPVVTDPLVLQPEAAQGSDDSGAGAPEEEAVLPTGPLPHTADDGAGEVWSVGVTDVVVGPELADGGPEAGTYAVGVVLDAIHDAGQVGFLDAFDVLVVGSDGVEYDYRDTYLTITPVDDIYWVQDDLGFTGAVVAVQLPEGVEPVETVLRPRSGQDAPDVVIPVG